MYPKYVNDGRSIVQLSSGQKDAIKKLQECIESTHLVMLDNKCLCKNEQQEKDVVLAQKDRYGIEISNILCSKCGLIRSDKIFDSSSNAIFYEKYYRNIYVCKEDAIESFFAEQVEKGECFLNLVKKYTSWENIKNVVEIGCGAGGILYPFLLNGRECKGYDFDDRYLNLGRNYGLTLEHGDYKNTLKKDTIHLIILSHVMEHFNDPIVEMQEIINKISIGGYLLVEVPGVFCIHNMYYDPLLYFQNAHVFNYYKVYLEVFFRMLGLDVVYGDERCTFLLHKPATWKYKKVQKIDDEKLRPYPRIILRYYKCAYLVNRFWINPWKWLNISARMLKKTSLFSSLRHSVAICYRKSDNKKGIRE